MLQHCVLSVLPVALLAVASYPVCVLHVAD
jgi:hypothetical protein